MTSRDPALITQNPSLTLVVPVFNEESRLARNGMDLINYIESKPAGSGLIIVNDGSTDGTARVACEIENCSSRARVVQLPHLGKGAAIAYGLAKAKTTLAGYTDVDLSTPLREVDRLFAAASRTHELVIGSRGLPEATIGNHQARVREVLGRMFNWYVQMTIAPGIKDTQCGAKFAQTTTWREILNTTREEGFAWDAEAVALAIRLGFGVLEVGIEWSHDPQTRVSVVADGMKMAWAVTRILTSLHGVPSMKRMQWPRAQGADDG